MRSKRVLQCAVAAIFMAFCTPLIVAVSAGAQTGHGGTPAFSEGGAIFMQTCEGCHGSDLSGGRGPSLFNPALFKRLTDAAIHQTVERGIKNSEMPPFAGALEGGQIDAIIAYLHRRSDELVAEASPAQAVAAPSNGRAPRARMLGGPSPNPDGQRIHSQTQDFQLKTLVDDLDTPYGLAFLPDGRLLVTERAPEPALRLIDPNGRRAPVRIKSLPPIHQEKDGGLLDVAVSPTYAQDGWVYLAYSESDPKQPRASQTVIVRGKIDASDRWGQQQILFRAPASSYTPSGFHYGARILFDGKGHILFSVGERGEMKNAQNLANPAGKIHRINLDGSVPADNPFVNRAGAMASVWSLGHRNPEGLAIDPATGLVWESEHGPSGGDEVNIIEPGSNYGWGVVSKGLQPGIKDVSAPGMVDPVAWYNPTIAPSGIAFYEGDRYAGWKGSLLLCGLRGQQLRRLTVKGREVVSEEVLFSGLGRVRAVATGPDGLLYVLMTDPTGPGSSINFTDPVRGSLVRLDPITWKQVEFRFQ